MREYAKGFARACRTRVCGLIPTALRMAAGGGSGGSGTSYRDTVMADSPVAYWRLGEPSGTTAADETGNHDGSYSNATLGATGLITGDTDTAVGFSNSAAQVSVTASAAFDNTTTGIAVEAWIKPVSGDLTGFPMIVCRGAVNTSWLLFLNNGKISFRSRSSPDEIATGATSLSAGTTYHIVGVHDGGGATGDLRVYVNGVEDGSFTSAARLNSANSIGIGRDVVSGANGFGGTLDEVAFYNKALTAAQILNHYNAGT